MARKLTVVLDLDARGVVRGVTTADGQMVKLDRAADRTGASFERMGRLIRTAFAFLFAGVLARQISQFSRRMFDLGTTVEETAEKFSTTFGEAAADVDAFLARFANMAGLTRQEGREITATLGAMSQGFGLTRREAGQFAEDVVRLAADLSSFNNVPIDDALRAIQSGLIGEQEPLRRFGILLSAATVEAKALEMRAAGVTGELSEQEKVMARLALATEMAGVAIGDLERTQDSTVNRARRLSAELRDQRDFLAQGMLPTYGLVLDVLTSLADRADGARMAFARMAAEGIFDVVTASLRLVASLGEALSGLASFVGASTQAGGAAALLGAAFEEVNETVVGATRFFNGLTLAIAKANEAYYRFQAGVARLTFEPRMAARFTEWADDWADRADNARDAMNEAGSAANDVAARAEGWRAQIQQLLDDFGEIAAGGGDVTQQIRNLLNQSGGTTAEEVEKIAALARDAALELRQLRIDAMPEGGERLRAQIVLDADRAIAAAREKYGALGDEIVSALEGARDRALRVLDAGGLVPITPRDVATVKAATVEIRDALRRGLYDTAREVEEALRELDEQFDVVTTQAARDEILRLRAELERLRDEMRGTAGDVESEMDRIAKAFEIDLGPVFGSRLEAIADEIDRYRRALEEATDPAVRARIEEHIAALRGLYAAEVAGQIGNALGNFGEFFRTQYDLAVEASADAYERMGMEREAALEKARADHESHLKAYKTFAKAQALIDTYAAAAAAYKALAGIPIVGPALGVAAAAAAVAAGLGYVAQIDAVGGGSGGSRGTSDRTAGVQARAKGGPVSAGSPYLVGEEGPELVIPKSAGYVVPANLTRALAESTGGGARGGTQRVHVTTELRGEVIGVQTDIEALQIRLRRVEEIQRYALGED